MLLAMLLKSFAGIANLEHCDFHSFRRDRYQIGGTCLNGPHEVAVSFARLSQRF